MDNKFELPFRVGKKQNRVILDANGHEVAYFNNSELAHKYCDFMNNTETKEGLICGIDTSNIFTEGDTIQIFINSDIEKVSGDRIPNQIIDEEAVAVKYISQKEMIEEYKDCFTKEEIERTFVIGCGEDEIKEFDKLMNSTITEPAGKLVITIEGMVETVLQQGKINMTQSLEVLKRRDLQLLSEFIQGKNWTEKQTKGTMEQINMDNIQPFPEYSEAKLKEMLMSDEPVKTSGGKIPDMITDEEAIQMDEEMEMYAKWVEEADKDLQREYYLRNNILILNQFPTHIAKTNNKVKENKYWKINSQGIYNGAIKQFTRAIVINNIHDYIIQELSKQELPTITEPVQLKLNIYIPINYSDIRRKKAGTISWSKPDEDYKPSNDEDNISWIWNKCIKDCLTKLGVWKDDNLSYCRGTSSLVHFVEDIEDRKIEISFISI